MPFAHAFNRPNLLGRIRRFRENPVRAYGSTLGIVAAATLVRLVLASAALVGVLVFSAKVHAGQTEMPPYMLGYWCAKDGAGSYKRCGGNRDLEIRRQAYVTDTSCVVTNVIEALDKSYFVEADCKAESGVSNAMITASLTGDVLHWNKQTLATDKPTLASHNTTNADTAGYGLLLWFLAFINLLPAIIAFVRRHNARGAILASMLLLDLIFVPTAFIGIFALLPMAVISLLWFACLIWSLNGNTQKRDQQRAMMMARAIRQESEAMRREHEMLMLE